MNNLSSHFETLYPQLEKYTQENQNLEINNYLKHSYCFYNFYTQNLNARVTKNKVFLAKAGIFINFFDDNLRALIVLNSNLHTSPSAMILRTNFEAFCNFSYILQKPEVRFDLYYRFLEIERFNGKMPKGKDFLNEAQKDEIRKKFPEWFYKNSKGEEKTRTHWSAEEVSFKKIATAVNQIDAYLTTYSQASLYVHCSSILKNIYSDGTPIPKNNIKDNLAVQAMFYGISFITTFFDFFGVEVAEEDLSFIGSFSVDLSKRI